MRMHRSLQALTLCAALVLSAGACSDSTSANGNARLSVLLTDAPGDLEKAVVTISEIYLKGEGGRVVLSDTAVTVDLLTLANDVRELVRSAVIPAGHYSELRMVITGGYVEAENADGSTSIFASSPSYAGLPDGATVAGALQMPSFAQSGLKVKFGQAEDFTIDDGETTLLLDFDVSQSFGKEAGNAGKWVMRPVVKGARVMEAARITVKLRPDAALALPTIGGVALTLADFRAEVTPAGGGAESRPFALEAGDDEWEAEFRYLLPGSYTVTLVGPAGVSFTAAPVLPVTVSVAEGQRVEQVVALSAVVAN